MDEIKNGNLQDYTGDFEFNGSMNIGPIEQKTDVSFKKTGDFESYINAIDIDYDSEDVTLTGYVYKLVTPQFNVVKRSVYAKGTNYMQEIVECRGQNCYIPTSGMRSNKNIKKFTEKGYKGEFSTFIRTEQKKSNVMTSARFQPFCGK